MTIREDVQLTIDNAAASRVEQRLADIKNESRQLAQALDRGEISADDFKRSISAIDSEARTLERSMKELNSELDRAAKPRTIDVRTEAFDRVSRDVSLAGDTQSNLGAISGIASGLGAGGLGSGVALGGEFVALVEELPRLKTAIQGMPQTINAAAGALGTTGAGLIGSLGIAAVAIGAVAIAFRKFTADAQKQAAALSGIIDARLETEKLVAGGASVDEARARLQALEQDRQAELVVLKDLESVYNEIPQGIRQFSAQGKELKKRIDELKRSSEDSKAGIDTLNTALSEGRFAKGAEQAQSAERQLAQARTQAAQTATQAAQAETSLFNNRLRSISNAYGGSGNPSRAGRGRPTVRRYGSFGGSRSTGAAPSSGGSSGPSRAEQIADMERELQQRRQDIVVQANDRLADIERSYYDDLESIRRDSARSERDAIRNRNFLALADTRDAEAERIMERKRAAELQARDVKIELERQRRELVTSAQRQRNEVVAVTNNMHNTVIRQTNDFGNRMIQTFGEIYKMLGYSSSRGSSLRRALS